MSRPDARVVAWRYRDAEMAERDVWHYLDLPPLNHYTEVEKLVPLSLLAEAESEIARLKLDVDAYMDAANVEAMRGTALQARLDGVPEIISGLEMANTALIGSNHAHRDIQKAIDFLRSAALGGESPGNDEVGS